MHQNWSPHLPLDPSSPSSSMEIFPIDKAGKLRPRRGQFVSIVTQQHCSLCQEAVSTQTNPSGCPLPSWAAGEAEEDLSDGNL